MRVKVTLCGCHVLSHNSHIICIRPRTDEETLLANMFGLRFGPQTLNIPIYYSDKDFLQKLR